MAIIIQNISPHNSLFGQQEYEIRIDQEVITTFTHKREEGLTVCLRKAAEAVERSKWMDTSGFMARLNAEIKAVEAGIAKIKKHEKKEDEEHD